MKRVVRRLALVTAAASSLWMLPGCGQRPRLDVVPTVEGSQVVFAVRHSGINGILNFRVEALDGSPLWQVATSYEKGRSVTYGVLPTGGTLPARQEYPPEGRPPPPIRGQRVRVVIEYQYDDGVEPLVGTFRKAVEVPGGEDGP